MYTRILFVLNEELLTFLQVDPEQVIMSHSPLKMFRQFLDKHVLVTGQGPVEEIARHLGFTRVTTMEKMRHCFPKLDMVDHTRRKTAVSLLISYYFINHQCTQLTKLPLALVRVHMALL